ncbi:MAG TPA: hypothetical protein VIJ95_14990 [Hanamia sp.]
MYNKRALWNYPDWEYQETNSHYDRFDFVVKQLLLLNSVFT